MGARRKRTMRKLTPVQIETLTYFYYGEVYCLQCHAQRGFHHWKWFAYDGVELTGRVLSLRRRRLVKFIGPPECRGLACTAEGRKVVEIHENA